MSRYLAIALSLCALSAPAQDTDVKGARVSLVRKSSAVLNVTIENRRDIPLVAWQIGLSAPGATFPRTIYGSDYSGRKIEPSQASGPIGPHQRRTIAIDLTNSPEVASAALHLVVFDDGHYEGVAAAMEPWLKTRQARLDDLRYWSAVFEVMPRVSETALRAYLASRLEDRADRGEDPSGVRVKLQNVLRQYPAGPDVWSGLDRLRADTQGELDALTRQPPGNAAAAGAVTSALILTQERAASSMVVAAIENLRNVSIEAFGFEILDPATDRAQSGQTADFCMGEPDSAQRGTARIPPGEIREIPLGLTVTSSDALPPVRLSFVIFDDLSAEGRAAGRDAALRERELRADDLAFALTALGQAVARPGTEMHAFLVEKRAERVRQLLAAGRRDRLMEIDELIRQAKESPDRMLANAKGLQEQFERTRRRLVRHLGR